MSAVRSPSLDAMLAALSGASAAPVRYSRTSLVARCEPVLLTALLAAIAVLGSVVACEATATPGPNRR